MWARLVCVGALVGWAVAGSACGGDGGGMPPPPGRRDAGVDAGNDAARPADGGVEGGTADDGGGDGGGMGGCVHDPEGDRFVLGMDSLGRARRVALAPVDDGAVLAAWAAVGGGDALPKVRVAVLGPSGSPSATRPVTDGSGTVRTPALVPRGSGGGALLAWVDSAPGSYEVMTMRLGPDGQPAGAPVRVTNNSLLESDPALAVVGSEFWLGWAQGDPLGDTQALVLQRLDADGRPSGALVPLDDGSGMPSALAMRGRSTGALIAWVEGGSVGERGVWSLPLSASGMPSIAKSRLDSEGVPVGTVALAGGAAFHLSAFDVDLGGRMEVRYRLLDADGVPMASVSPIHETDGTMGPGAASFRGGWAVAYRLVPDGDVARTRIEVALVDVTGTVVERFDLGSASFQGGPVSVAVGSQGDLFVGYLQEDDEGRLQVHLSRVRCSGGSGGMASDGGMDAGADALPDAVGPPPDAGACLDDMGRPDPCACPPVLSCAGGTGCPGASVCIADGCGGERCVSPGRTCRSPGDCPAGSTCTPQPDIGVSFCVPDGTSCNDSRDCPLGFACESGGCVDRRIACTPGGDDCPFNFYCHVDPLLGAGFCLPVHVPCATDASCLIPASRCLDVRGTGEKVCAFSGRCTTNADCAGNPSGPLCTSAPAILADCGPNGVCGSDADCVSGFVCRDLWGDGVRTCVPAGGSCTTSAECPAGQVCAPMESDVPPACVGTPVGS